MSDNLTLSGQLVITPDQSQSDAALSGDFAIAVPLTAALTLSRKAAARVVLADTTLTTVDLSDIVSVHVLVLKTSDAIAVHVTSASGTLQVIPVDDTLVLITTTTPITALKVQAATTANVSITMGRV